MTDAIHSTVQDIDMDRIVEILNDLNGSAGD